MCSHPQIFEFLLKTSMSATVPITGDIVVKQIYQWNSCSNENIYIVREIDRERESLELSCVCAYTRSVHRKTISICLVKFALGVYLRIKGTHIFKIQSYENQHVNRITCWILDTAHPRVLSHMGTNVSLIASIPADIIMFVLC